MRSMGDAIDGADRTPSPDAAGHQPEPEHFLAAFETLTQAIRRARGTSALDAEDRLSLSQYTLLRALADRDAARVSDLAGDAAISPSTATRILDALERRAIVRRDRVAADRRTVTVTLTPIGRAALTRQDAWVRGRQRAFFDELPDEQRGVACGLLHGMASLIDELAAGPPPPASVER